MKAIQQLKEEHEGVKVMLAVLERVCRKLEETRHLDQKHFEKILEFLKVFVDRCHHGKEEELLFPANTQVAVFVSMDVGDFFALDSISLKIDNREVSSYLYTPREAAALVKGGVQRLYVGNLKAGSVRLENIGFKMHRVYRSSDFVQ